MITLTALTLDDLDAALGLSRQADWPHRREDWAMMLAVGEGIAARLDEEVVGTALLTTYGGAATIGMVIVAEASRGRGVGRALMQAALERAQERDIRLTATAAGLPLYRGLGFVETDMIRQHGGPAPRLTASGPVAATAADRAALAVLDRDAFGADRGALWAALAATAAISVIRRDGAVRAGAALRRFGRGLVLGPIVSETVADAETLVAHAAARADGAYLRVDTPASSGLSDRLAALGLPVVGGGIVMRRGVAAPNVSGLKTFGLASQALG